VQQALRASLGSDGAQAVCTPSSPTKAPPVARGRAANPAPTARVPRGPAVTDVAPVWLWLQPGTPAGDPATVRPDPAAASDTGHRPPPGDDKRRRARRVQEASEREAMLMFFRAESLLTWGEFIQVNRASDDDENDDALTAADDMDELAVAPDGEACAARVRFDLDLPSAAEDDRPLGEGIALPEWDWRAGVLRPGHCRAQLMEPRDPAPFVPDAALHRLAARTRRRMELLRAAPRWRHAQRDGDELDLDAFVRLAAEATHDDAPPVLSQRVKQDRSLAVLLLADLSLSTDAWVPGGPESGAGTGRGAGDASHVPAPRVIDVIREAMQLVGHALAASGDAFEMLGFSSVRRQQVRIQRLKDFDERWGPRPQARIGAIRPGYYTRMGAALRVATERLGRRPERQRLLLLLTDGKPNDLDVYEGRYGLEDTRHAVQAARAAGLVPFAVTIDPEGHDWLPYLFGRPHYALLHQPQQLATRLAQVVGALARQAG
jgi:nitric oxide reductase NorD protein